MKKSNKMAKVKKIFYCICFLSSLCLIMLSACTTSSVRYVQDLSYIEWRDENGIFNFRAAKDGSFGCGTIVLNGEEIPASFGVGANKPAFLIYISVEDAEKLGYEFQYSDSGIVTDSFVPEYSKSDKVITSKYSDVELFGVKVGKVRLKAYPLDKSEFAIWEIFSRWTDSENRLEISNSEESYVHNKCLSAYAKLTDGGRKYITFRWLPETSGFCIYERVDWYEYATITDDTPRLAEGTYEQDGNNVTLYFSKDELLGLQGQSLYLSEM